MNCCRFVVVMKLLYFYISVFVLLASKSVSQSPQLDSLKAVYRTSTEDSIRIKSIKSICDIYNSRAYLNDDSLRVYSKVGIDLMKASEKKEGLADMHMIHGLSHYYSDTSAYFAYMKEAEQIAINDKDLFLAMYANLRQMSRYQNFSLYGKVDEALRRGVTYIQELQSSEKSSEKEDIIASKIYGKAAINALSLGNAEDALRWTAKLRTFSYDKSCLVGKVETYTIYIDIYKEILINIAFGQQSEDKNKIDSMLRTSIDSMYTLTHQAVNHTDSKSKQKGMLLGRYTQSLIHKADYSLENQQIDTAYVYYTSALHQSRRGHQNLSGLRSLGGLLDVCMLGGQTENCSHYFVKIDSILKKVKTDSWSINLLGKKIKYYSLHNDYSKADIFYNKLKILLEKYKDKHEYLEAYDAMIAYAKKRNKIQDAYHYFQRKSTMQDSLKAQVLTRDIEALRIKYDVANTKAINAQLKKDQAIQELKTSRTISGLVLLSVLLLSAAMYYILRNRNKHLESERQKAHFKQRMLRSQISPHFTFNVLGTIQGYIYENKLEAAEKALGSFAKLIRKSLEYTTLQAISLDEEIDFIYRYLDLEKNRRDGLFDFEITVNATDDSLTKRKIQPLFVQPIVENSIKHGFRDMDEGGLIKIDFDILSSGIVRIHIMDNGAGYPASKSSTHKSLGLSLIQERMEILNQTTTSYTMEVKTSSSGTTTTLTLPYE